MNFASLPADAGSAGVVDPAAAPLGAPPFVRGSALEEFRWGLRLFGRGFLMYRRYPAAMAKTLIPALIALVVQITAFSIVLYRFRAYDGDGGRWVDDVWDSGRWGELAAFLALIWLATVSFSWLTLIIGDPFYEKLSERIEHGFGDGPAHHGTWYTSMARAVVESLRIITVQIVIGLPLLLVGTIPWVGAVLAFAIGAVVNGWLYCLELTGVPFNRRGLYLAKRRRLLRGHRAFALGFGIPTALLLMIPFANAVVFPAGVAGATLLARRLEGRAIG